MWDGAPDRCRGGQTRDEDQCLIPCFYEVTPRAAGVAATGPGTLVDRSPKRHNSAKGVAGSYQRPETRNPIIPGSARGTRARARGVWVRPHPHARWCPADSQTSRGGLRRESQRRTLRRLATCPRAESPRRWRVRRPACGLVAPSASPSASQSLGTSPKCCPSRATCNGGGDAHAPLSTRILTNT